MLEPVDPKVLERRYNLEEYMALPEGPPYYELDDGVLVEVFSTHGYHGMFMGRIYALLDTWCQAHGGWVSLEVGTLPGGNRGYIPDLIYLSADHLDRFIDGRIHGVPDLAVEIYNRDGARRDRVQKFNLYRKAGIEWYWLVDWEGCVLEEYHLVDGAYVRTTEAGAGDEFRPQALPGLIMNVDDINRH